MEGAQRSLHCRVAVHQLRPGPGSDPPSLALGISIPTTIWQGLSLLPPVLTGASLPRGKSAGGSRLLLLCAPSPGPVAASSQALSATRQRGLSSPCYQDPGGRHLWPALLCTH